MSATVCERIVSALVTSLNTWRPTGLPVFERDRWWDADLMNGSVCSLSGWEDKAAEGQTPDRALDRRVLMLSFALFSHGLPVRMSDGSNLMDDPGNPDGVNILPAVPATTAIDAMWAWLVAQCGVPAQGSALAALGVARVLCMRRLAAVDKGDAVRCLVELEVHYQHLVNDATRAA